MRLFSLGSRQSAVGSRLSGFGIRRWAFGIGKRTVQMIGFKKLLLITSDMVAPWAAKDSSNDGKILIKRKESRIVFRPRDPRSVCVLSGQLIYIFMICMHFRTMACFKTTNIHKIVWNYVHYYYYYYSFGIGWHDRVERVLWWSSQCSALSLCYFICFEFKSINAAGHLRVH